MQNFSKYADINSLFDNHILAQHPSNKHYYCLGHSLGSIIILYNATDFIEVQMT